jgi:hypothetical protein
MRKLLIVILLFCSIILNAKTSYVATTGNNSNNGTIGSPWLTIAYAVSQSTSGDIIHVNAGSYTISTMILVPVGISIEGDGTTTILNSTVTAQYNMVFKLNSTSENTNGNQSISYMKFEGALTAYSIIEVNARSNVSIHHCTFEHFFFEGVTFDSRINGSGGLPTVKCTGNSFHDNIMTDCGSSGGTADTYQGNLLLSSQKDINIYNNTITSTLRAAGSSYSGFPIKFKASGYCEGVHIYNDTLIMHEGGIWEFAIEMWNSRGGIEVNNCYIQGTIDVGCDGAHINNDAAGYGFAWKIHDNWIGHTSMRSGDETGIDLERSLAGGVYIYKNYFKNLSLPVTTSMGSNESIDGLYIYYNIINGVGAVGQNSLGKGLSLGHGAGPVTYSNIYVCNNTIYAGTGGLPLDGIRMQFNGTATNIVVRNNIIEGFPNNCSIYVMNSTITGMSVENNIFYNNGLNTPTYVNSTITNKTEQNNLTFNPLFVSLGTDFHLQSNSPAINTGLHIVTPTMTTDYDGVTISNPPEIGVYEYGAAPPTVVVATVTTTSVSNIASTSASSGGNVTNAGGGTVSARGICWSTSINPTVANTHTTDGSGTGVFTSAITGLTGGTIYHVRAYATNEAGVGYGSDQTFTTSVATMLHDINGKILKSGGKILIVK